MLNNPELTPIRVGLAGAGVMGGNHARVLNDSRSCELVGILDSNLEAAKSLATSMHCDAFSDPKEFFESANPESIIVATPTVSHSDLCIEALSQGIHVLVEKPIAASVAEAEAMIRASDRSGALLCVGHIERFNPAVVELKRRLDDGQLGKIFYISAHRASPFPARISDVGVVSDLGTHELDLICWLNNSPIESISAINSSFVHRSREDFAMATLRFENGVVAGLKTDWVSPARIRELTVAGESGMFVVNYLTQELFFYQNPANVSPIEGAAWDFTIKAGDMVRYEIYRQEPLREEIESFLQAVVAKDRSFFEKGADGKAGLKALELALQIAAPKNSVGRS